jgi:hypothetical protein
MPQRPRPTPPRPPIPGGAVRAALLPGCLLLLALLTLSACGTYVPVAGSPTPSPSSAATATPAASPAPFTVASVDLAVSPASIAGAACGSQASFTYTATFHIPAGTAGGTIQFGYTLNNGRSQTPGTVAVPAGATSQTFTFTSSGALPPDHTYPGVAIVMVTSPNNILSPSAQPSGSCS